MAVEMDIVDYISDLLQFGDISSLKSVINDENYEVNFKEKASDIIMSVIFHLTKETMENKPSVFHYTEKILSKCAEKGNPRECLMEFLAQIETLDEIKVKYLLKPIQTVMLRIPERKGPLMQCVFNVLHSFINSLRLPQYHHFDEKSKLLIDCDENAMKIRDTYQCLLDLYEPFVNDASVKSNDKRIRGQRLVVLQALFHLLGNPLVHLDLEYHETAPSKFRSFASIIVKYINKLQSNPFAFLTMVEDKQFLTVEEEKLIIKEFSSNDLLHSDLSLASFFYLIFAENMHTTLPYVYNEVYIIENCFSLAATLLRYKERMVLIKGLLLTKAIVQRTQPGTLTYISSAHEDVIEHLATISTFHDIKEDRQLAIDLINQCFFMFEPQIQYNIMLNLKNNTNIHPNVIGYFILVLKKCIQNGSTNDRYKKYFSGKRLIDLLKIFCLLKKGAESDLIENKEPILSALNLIMSLAKDKENFTVIRDCKQILNKQFLFPLREGLKLSKAHFKLELGKLNEPVVKKDAVEMMVTVGEDNVSNMSPEKKKNVLDSGLTTLDLIEHQLCWTNEYIEDINS